MGKYKGLGIFAAIAAAMYILLKPKKGEAIVEPIPEPEPFLSLISPENGDSLLSNSESVITWDSYGTGRVSVCITVKDGAPVWFAADYAKEFAFVVPDAVGKTLRIFIGSDITYEFGWTYHDTVTVNVV